MTLSKHARRQMAITAGAVLGWVLYDLAALTTTPRPALALQLLPACIIAVVVGALLGLLWGLWPRVIAALTVGAGVLAIASGFEAAQLPLQWVWLPRAVLLLIAAAGTAAYLAPRLRLSAPGAGLALGAAGAMLMAGFTGKATGLSGLVVVAAATCGLASTRITHPAVRRLGIAAAAVIPLLLVWVGALHRTQLRRPDQPLPSIAADPGRPNLIMIVLDTVGADHLAMYGYDRVTTPEIDQFVRRCATLYTEAYAISSWTLPSHGSLFTGLYPSQHGAHRAAVKDRYGFPKVQRLRADVPTLAERLSAFGYQTAAIVANAHYLGHDYGLDRGFAHYDDRWGAHLDFLLLPQLAGFLPALGQSVHRSAETITNLAMDWLGERQQQRPFFLFLNYMDPHAPYLPRPPFDRAFSDQQPPDPYDPPQSLFALSYDRELAFLDYHVARLLQDIEARGLLDDTAVIITSDHGEAFGEHGTWWHDNTLYSELLRVPLYVKSAGKCRTSQSTERVTTVDVHHLALHEVGVEASMPAADPARVIAELHGVKNPFIMPDRDLLAWISDGVKWIVSSTGSVEAYALDSDPGERHNLALDREQIEQAHAYAARWWEAHPPTVATEGQPRAPDAETRERLRALGY
jgi:arylsulfatase A-like enzyme